MKIKGNDEVTFFLRPSLLFLRDSGFVQQSAQPDPAKPSRRFAGAKAAPVSLVWLARPLAVQDIFAFLFKFLEKQT